MADIRVNSTGKIFYQIDNAVALLLKEAFPESFSAVERPIQTPRPSQPKWAVGKNNADYPQITLTKINNEVIHYPGPMASNGFYGSPEEAAASFKAIGFPVPLDVLAEFERAVKQTQEQNQARRLTRQA